MLDTGMGCLAIDLNLNLNLNPSLSYSMNDHVSA